MSRGLSAKLAPIRLVLLCLPESPMVLCLSFDGTKYQRDRQNTFQGQENSTTYPCLGIFMNKNVFNLTSTISSALFRVFLFNSFKTRNSRKSWGNKVLRHILTTHTELLTMYRPTNACQLLVSSKTQMRKTTVDQVMEGLKSECRGDLRVAAEMSNQTLLWASSTDQSQCNQA